MIFKDNLKGSDYRYAKQTFQSTLMLLKVFFFFFILPAIQTIALNIKSKCGLSLICTSAKVMSHHVKLLLVFTEYGVDGCLRSRNNFVFS